MIVGPGRDDAVIDDEDGVVVEGAQPGGEVRLDAEVELRGVAWRCSGVYVADAGGRVDTTRDASIGNDYTGVDPFGLLWSVEAPGRPTTSAETPMRVRVTARCGDMVAEAAYERAWLRPGVRAEDVDQGGLVGRLYLPPGDDLPAVVVLGGSEGGVPAPLPSALLSGHGIAVLALATWRAPGLPPAMADLDVEVVGRAADLLRSRPGVRDARPSVVGISRGGELALLAASLLPEQVGSAISLVGSALPWGALGTGDDNDVAWRFAGEPVAKIWEDADDPDRWLADEKMVAAAEIPVERVQGRVLLLSGQDDAMWPSALLSEYAVRRAERLGVGDRVEHVAYPDAGHFCCTPPGFAVQSEVVHSLDGAVLPIGGTLAGNQAARRDSWRRTVAFLAG